MKVRTRFAPSPTGALHIGSIRTALYCYALAKKHDGKYLLRLEDTDRSRYVEGSTEEIFEMLSVYGLEPNESMKHGGDYGPYVQSERLELYQEHAHKLVEMGHAYYCFLTPEETKELQQAARAQKQKFRSPYRDLNLSEAKQKVATGESYVIRQKMPTGREIEYTDGLQGHMKFNTDEVDEGVLLKSDGFPTYHLAVIIDDHLMEITHVFRGTEWIPSIPKHVMLYESFGWEMPDIYHVTTVLDPNGGKLSKRNGSVAAQEFLVEGYLPEAILNFLMLLGWAAPIERHRGEQEQEIFSLSEFVEMFELSDLNRSNPVFDRDKLIWFNTKYMNTMPSEQLAGRYIEWLRDYAADKSLLAEAENDTNLVQKITLIGERVKLMPEINEMMAFFYNRPGQIDWGIKQLKRVSEEQRLKALNEFGQLFTRLDVDSTEWVHEDWEQEMREIADRSELKHGDTFMLLRVAMTGGPVSPPLFESLQLLGQEEVLFRLGSIGGVSS